MDDICAEPVQDIVIDEVSHHNFDVNRKKENDIALIRLKYPARLGR